MRKTLATTVLTLSLAFAGAPAFAVDDPNAPSTNPQCQGATNQVCDWLIDWARLAKSLEDTVAQQSATVTQQSAKIAKQRATIKRLRAKLARTR